MSTITDLIMVRIDAASAGAIKELGRLQTQTKRTSDAFDNMSKKVGVSSQTLKVGLAAAATAATALLGTGLASFLTQSAQAYADAATAASILAKTTNSTVEEASRFAAITAQIGLNTNDLVEIFAQFGQTAQASADELSNLGVELAKTPQGTIDWTATLVDFLDVLQKMPDATERSRLMFKYLGEEGAKQLTKLVASGVDLRESMEAISTAQVFGKEDVASAAAYNQAMRDITSSAKDIQFAVGRYMVPALTTAATAFTSLIEFVGPVLDVMAEIPPDIYLVAGAFAVLNKALGTTVALNVGAALARIPATLGFMAVTGTLATSAVSGLKGAWTGLAAVVAANPVGVALLSLAAMYGALSFASSQLKSAAEEALPAMQKLKAGGLEASAALDQTALGLTQTEGFWSRVGAGFRGMDSIGDFFSGLVSDTQALENQTKGYAEALEEAEKKMGAFGVASAAAAAGVKDVKDAAADLATGSGYAQIAYSNLVASAQDAQQAAYDTARATSTAESAMGEYAVSIQQVVDWQGKLAGQTATVEEALNNIQESYQTLVTDKEGKRFWQKITDDVQTFGDESEIAMSNAKVAIFDYIDALAAIPGTTSTEIVANLEKLKEQTPGEIDKIINEVISQIEGKPNEVGVNLDLKPVLSYQGKTYPEGFIGPIPLEAEMTVGGVPVTQKVNVTTAVDPKSLSASKSKLDALAKDRHTTIYVKVKPQGQSVADIVGQPGGNMYVPGAASYSSAYSTRFDLRGSTFVTPDPAAMYDQLNRMAARRKLAGRR